MQVLHITPNTNGYEVVNLIANKVSKTNSLHLIEKGGEKYMSGGFILHDTPQIRGVLDSIEKEKQYHFVLMFKCDPFRKQYEKDENTD